MNGSIVPTKITYYMPACGRGCVKRRVFGGLPEFDSGFRATGAGRQLSTRGGVARGRGRFGNAPVRRYGRF